MGSLQGGGDGGGRGSLIQQKKGEPRDEEGPRAGVVARGPGSVLRAGRAVASVMGTSLGSAWLRAPGFIIAIVIVSCAGVGGRSQAEGPSWLSSCGQAPQVRAQERGGDRS